MGHDFVGIESMGLRVVALLDIHRMRLGIVVQAGDVPQLEG